MSCGCDTSKQYDVANIPEWIVDKLYVDGELAKCNNTIYTAKGIIVEQTMGPAPFPGLPGIPMFNTRVNIGQQPPNQFWLPVPYENCFNSQACTTIAATATPVAATPTIIDALTLATGQSQNILPAVVPPETTAETLVPQVSGSGDLFDMDDDDDFEITDEPTHTMPDGTEMAGSMYDAHIAPLLEKIPEIPQLEDFTTKHMIIGLAGALTLILLFK